jgi:hypothetical protein
MQMEGGLLFLWPTLYNQEELNYKLIIYLLMLTYSPG